MKAVEEEEVRQPAPSYKGESTGILTSTKHQNSHVDIFLAQQSFKM